MPGRAVLIASILSFIVLGYSTWQRQKHGRNLDKLPTETLELIDRALIMKGQGK